MEDLTRKIERDLRKLTNNNAYTWQVEDSEPELLLKRFFAEKKDITFELESVDNEILRCYLIWNNGEPYLNTSVKEKERGLSLQLKELTNELKGIKEEFKELIATLNKPRVGINVSNYDKYVEVNCKINNKELIDDLIDEIDEIIWKQTKYNRIEVSGCGIATEMMDSGADIVKLLFKGKKSLGLHNEEANDNSDCYAYTLHWNDGEPELEQCSW